jgi:hypothetical protein
MFFEANKRKQKYNRLLKLLCVKLMIGNRKQKKYQKSHPFPPPPFVLFSSEIRKTTCDNAQPQHRGLECKENQQNTRWKIQK